MELSRALAAVLVAALLCTIGVVRSEEQCEVGTVYKSSFPAGGKSVGSLSILDTSLDVDQCIASCCDLGPEGCQFLWILQSTCIAVACDKEHEALCQPKQSKADVTSVYIEIKTHEKNSLKDVFKWALEHISNGAQVTLPPTTTTPDEDDSPPMAATPTDEITITSPTSEVTLYGNYSSDDKGIVSYSWKLLSQHSVQPILENADKAIMHVRNLVPGTYQFSLLVTDTRGQSAKTTVIVHVKEGPTQATTISTTTVPTTAGTPATSRMEPNGTLAVNSTEVVDEQDANQGSTVRHNTMKIVIPVLISVSLLFITSAAVVVLIACCLERNKHRMKRYYKYKRLPETIEKL